MKKYFLIIWLVVGVITITFSQQPKPLTKAKTIALYKTLYLSSELTSMPWSGDEYACESGTLDSIIYVKVVNRVNFFRQVNGLGAVKLDTHLNIQAQDAALLVKANNQLTHDPASSMKCYSESAYNGCKKSCLEFTDFRSYPATAFITGFVEEYGSRNYFVGHRRWILYSKLKTIGYGATNNSEALLVVDGVAKPKDTLPPMPEYTAYPWSGYVPLNLIFPKWSFSIPEANLVDFTGTTITMTDSAGKNIQLQKLANYSRFLDHTLVWSVTGLFTNDDTSSGQRILEGAAYLNKKIKVTISNVKVNGVMRNYVYTVVPFKM